MNIARTLTFLIVLLTLYTTSAQADETQDRAAIREEAANAYRAGDIESLERQHARYSAFLTQRTASGAFKMAFFFEGVARALPDPGESELQADIARTLAWARERKDSPLRHILHAAALQAYGRYFRGGGYSSSVSPQAWKIHEEYIRRAGQYLIANEAVASKSSTWHSRMIEVAKWSSWPPELVERLFEAGRQVDPNDYTLYGNVIEYLLPKWHGNALLLDRFIRDAVNKAPAFGPELYARLYSLIEQGQFQRRLYIESLIEWPTMREGLDLWYQRFPTSWNKNIVAYHACIAGDKALAKQLLDEIGTRPEWDIWRPEPKVTYDTCTRWAADPDAEPKSPRKPIEEQGAQAPGSSLSGGI